jgi:hypothetical protein
MICSYHFISRTLSKRPMIFWHIDYMTLLEIFLQKHGLFSRKNCSLKHIHLCQGSGPCLVSSGILYLMFTIRYRNWLYWLLHRWRCNTLQDCIIVTSYHQWCTFIYHTCDKNCLYWMYSYWPYQSKDCFKYNGEWIAVDEKHVLPFKWKLSLLLYWHICWLYL